MKKHTLLAVLDEAGLCEEEQLGILGVWETTGDMAALGVTLARGRELLAMETASFFFGTAPLSKKKI